MIESFLKKNWRTVWLVGVILWAFFVWPTPYAVYREKDDNLSRMNRFTGKQEDYWSLLARWIPSDAMSFYQASKATDVLRDKAKEAAGIRK